MATSSPALARGDAAAGAPAGGETAQGQHPQSRLLLRQLPGAEGHHPAALRPAGHRLHRPVGLRQVHPAAHPEPHLRPLPGPAGDRRGAARRREHPGAGRQTSTCCAPGSAWCSRSRRRSRCRSTTTSPSASASTSACPRRRWTSRVEAALRKRGAVGRGQGQAAPERPQPLGRPAAAPVHRARDRGPARGHPARRAGLGARPDLDRQDRGADRRAEGRLHHRDRHPQHAAGGAHLATTPPSCTWAS